jgi:taurine dioxygenase|tara:strand:- start:256 stop:1086 length:831 start_codon:yes stop_codon:yes gene_type:complete
MIQVNPLSDTNFFAEVTGADLKRDDDEQFAAIKAAHLKHGVIVIRGQSMTPDDQIRFSRRFGPLAIHVLEDQLLEGHPEILLVSNKTEDGRYVGLPDAGRFWHTDQSYEEKPALGSLLFAIEVPADGSGDTWFCDMTSAYDALTDDMKTRLDGLRGKHIYNHSHENFSLNGEQQDRLPGYDHPLVRTHPETGRKALYLGGKLLKFIVGMDETESVMLLNDLYGHCQDDRFIYKHKWRQGDLVFWDNRCTMHYAQPYDDKRYTRHMHRTTVQGDRPA